MVIFTLLGVFLWIIKCDGIGMSQDKVHPLKKYRKLARLTQQKLADLATEINKLEKPINTAHVSRIESFEFNLTRDMEIIYANALNTVLENKINPWQLSYDVDTEDQYPYAEVPLPALTEKNINDSSNNLISPIDSPLNLAQPNGELVKTFDKSGVWLKVLNPSALSGGNMSECQDRIWVDHFSLENSISKNPEDILIIINVGDALSEPHGARFFLDTKQIDPSFPAKYGIYIDDTPMVRTLQILPNKRMRVLTDNDAYPALELGLDEIKIIGRCIQVQYSM